MRIGDMRHIILVKQSTKTRTDSGAVIEVWTTVNRLRAIRNYLSGSKDINNREIFNSSSLEFITYYRKNINDNMRIEFEGDNYIINSIEIDNNYISMKIKVEKINE